MQLSLRKNAPKTFLPKSFIISFIDSNNFYLPIAKAFTLIYRIYHFLILLQTSLKCQFQRSAKLQSVDWTRKIGFLGLNSIILFFPLWSGIQMVQWLSITWHSKQMLAVKVKLHQKMFRILSSQYQLRRFYNNTL